MMNLSRVMVSDNILVTLVVPQEWVASQSHPKAKHQNIKLAWLPKLHPCHSNNLVQEVMSKMEPLLRNLLHRLSPPPTLIICDAFLFWLIPLANHTNIPVAAFWTTNTSELWLQYYHFFHQNHHSLHNIFDYIPSTSWIPGSDVPLLEENNRQILQWALKCCEWLPKAQYLLLPSFYELESQVIDVLKDNLLIPIYTIGPNIPYFIGLGDNSCDTNNNGGSDGYKDWLDCQPTSSVLYISHGSYLSISSVQMNEIANALHDSNVRFIWVTRMETPRLKEICGDMGLVVAWCDQLRVLLHPSIGGYWTHCGWNSVMEGIFAGVPFLTFPLVMDQPLISKLIVEDWKIGWRVKKDDKLDTLVKKYEIVVLFRKFMNLDADVSRDVRKRAKELQHMAQLAINKNGSSETNIQAFMKSIVQSGSNRA